MIKWKLLFAYFTKNYLIISKYTLSRVYKKCLTEIDHLDHLW